MTPLDALSEALAQRVADLVAEKLRPARPPKEADRLLSLGEAAAMLGMTVAELRRRAHKLPFTVKLGHRTRGFSLRGIQAWIERGGER